MYFLWQKRLARRRRASNPSLASPVSFTLMYFFRRESTWFPWASGRKSYTHTLHLYSKILSMINQLYKIPILDYSVKYPISQCSGSMTFWCGSGPNAERIRILLFSSLIFKTPTKNYGNLKISFSAYYFLKVHYIIFQR